MENYLKELEVLKKKENKMVDAQAYFDEIIKKSKEEQRLADLEKKKFVDDELNKINIDDLLAHIHFASNENAAEEIAALLKKKEYELKRQYDEMSRVKDYNDISIVKKIQINNLNQEFKLNFDVSFLNCSEDQIKSRTLELCEFFVEEMLKIKHEKVFVPFSQEDRDKYVESAAMPKLSAIEKDEVVKFLELYKKQRSEFISNKEDELFNILNK